MALLLVESKVPRMLVPQCSKHLIRCKQHCQSLETFFLGQIYFDIEREIKINSKFWCIILILRYLHIYLHMLYVFKNQIKINIQTWAKKQSSWICGFKWLFMEVGLFYTKCIHVLIKITCKWIMDKTDFISYQSKNFPSLPTTSRQDIWEDLQLVFLKLGIHNLQTHRKSKALVISRAIQVDRRAGVTCSMWSHCLQQKHPKWAVLWTLSASLTTHLPEMGKLQDRVHMLEYLSLTWVIQKKLQLSSAMAIEATWEVN